MSTWKIDPAHTSVGFEVKHMMFSTVRGTFSDVDATIEFDPTNPEAARVDAVIRTASISTGAEDRDNHLRSADFFEVEKYPEMTFRSKQVKAHGSDRATIIGDLTIRDVTREVELDVDFLGTGQNPYGITVAGFEANGRINREDFGLTWNVALEAGGVLVGKEIKITLNVQAALAEEAQPA